jgi:hypothetical protein
MNSPRAAVLSYTAVSDRLAACREVIGQHGLHLESSSTTLNETLPSFLCLFLNSPLELALGTCP